MAATLQEVPARLAPIKAAQEFDAARVAHALRRLRDLLPLKERQQSLHKPVAEVHRALLRSLLDRGIPLTGDEIAGMLGSKDAAVQAVAQLGSLDLIVCNELTARTAETNGFWALDDKGREVVGAYPMTTEVTPHQVAVNGHGLYAMCAVDALAIGPMFDTETLIQSRCHVTGAPISIHQKGGEILETEPSNEIRVGVRWQRLATCCAHDMCRQMAFFKDPETAIAWQDRDPSLNELFTLQEAVEIGQTFFLPLLAE